MKKILLSTTMFLALTATANAQDVSVSTSIDYVPIAFKATDEEDPVEPEVIE